MDQSFIISRGSDDQRAIRVPTFREAELVARDQSTNQISYRAIITTWQGHWLATYRNGKLERCDLYAIELATRDGAL